MPETNQGTSVGRRRFLTVSGTVLGGIAAGTTVAAASSEERFIVDTSTLRGDLSDSVEIIHDLSEIDVAVVRGSESDLEGVTKDYEPDTTYTLDEPIDEVVEIESDAEASDAAFYGLQWDKQAQDVPAAQEVTEGEGTRVSVIDTGIDPTHPDLAGPLNTNLSRNFTDDGGDFSDASYHGTHVSGIVAASGLGTLGTAPETDLVACRVFSDSGGASFGDILAAIVYSVGIDSDVVNMSLGAYPIPRQGIGQFYGGVLNRVTTYANSNETLIVAAAGNDSADLQHDGGVISLPNEAANVMSISATGPIGFKWGDAGLEDPPWSPAFYTNYGTNAIDVSAPGGDADLDAARDGVPGWYYDLVFNTIPGGWAWLAGTSMASPQVAGAAALVKSANPDYNANQVRQTLERTADDVGDKAYHGSGFLNPLDAVQD